MNEETFLNLPNLLNLLPVTMVKPFPEDSRGWRVLQVGRGIPGYLGVIPQTSR
ncbi:hypothetical protein ACFY1P_08245 [Streptomyces sp. NPDC001407]|uniref:hypothetical protein n=1 Tax=Streptomyces sp. NPDC001407 TaxID=3364573 RepID=UPI0036857068